MRKISRAGIVKKLDKIVSQYVVSRDGSCVVCGSTESLGAGHVFSRKAYNTRWDITKDGNVHAQCWPCNYRHVRDQYPYFNWYETKFGKGSLDELRKRFKTSAIYKTHQLVELYESISSTQKEEGGGI